MFFVLIINVKERITDSFAIYWAIIMNYRVCKLVDDSLAFDCTPFKEPKRHIDMLNTDKECDDAFVNDKIEKGESEDDSSSSTCINLQMVIELPK